MDRPPFHLKLSTEITVPWGIALAAVIGAVTVVVAALTSPYVKEGLLRFLASGIANAFGGIV